MNDGRAGLAEWLCCSSLALRPTLSGSLPFALFLDTFSLLFIHCFYEEASIVRGRHIGVFFPRLLYQVVCTTS